MAKPQAKTTAPAQTGAAADGNVANNVNVKPKTKGKRKGFPSLLSKAKGNPFGSRRMPFKGVGAQQQPRNAKKPPPPVQKIKFTLTEDHNNDKDSSKMSSLSDQDELFRLLKVTGAAKEEPVAAASAGVGVQAQQVPVKVQQQEPPVVKDGSDGSSSDPQKYQFSAAGSASGSSQFAYDKAFSSESTEKAIVDQKMPLDQRLMFEKQSLHLQPMTRLVPTKFERVNRKTRVEQTQDKIMDLDNGLKFKGPSPITLDRVQVQTVNPVVVKKPLVPAGADDAQKATTPSVTTSTRPAAATAITSWQPPHLRAAAAAAGQKSVPPPPVPGQDEKEKKIAFEKVKALLGRMNGRSKAANKSGVKHVTSEALLASSAVTPQANNRVVAHAVVGWNNDNNMMAPNKSPMQARKMDPTPRAGNGQSPQPPQSPPQASQRASNNDPPQDAPTSPVVHRVPVDAPPVCNMLEQFVEPEWGPALQAAVQAQKALFDGANKALLPQDTTTADVVVDAVQQHTMASTATALEKEVSPTAADKMLLEGIKTDFKAPWPVKDSNAAVSTLAAFDASPAVSSPKSSAKSNVESTTRVQRSKSASKELKALRAVVSADDAHKKKALLSPPRPMLSVKTNPFDDDSSDDDIPAPAVDAAAMMAALESTLPLRSPTKRRKAASSPRKKARSPRKSSKKKSGNLPSPLTEANDSRETLRKKAEMKAEKHKQKSAFTAEEARFIARQAMESASKPSKSHGRDPPPEALTEYPSIPLQEVVLSADEPISDLDQSLRAFPVNVVDQGSVDVSRLGETRNGLETEASSEDDVDRYAPLVAGSASHGEEPLVGKREHPGAALADSITEWSVEQAESDDTRQVAGVEVTLNAYTCAQAPLGFLASACLGTDHVSKAPVKNRLPNVAKSVSKTTARVPSPQRQLRDKTPKASNRVKPAHFFAEDDNDQNDFFAGESIVKPKKEPLGVVPVASIDQMSLVPIRKDPDGYEPLLAMTGDEPTVAEKNEVESLEVFHATSELDRYQALEESPNTTSFSTSTKSHFDPPIDSSSLDTIEEQDQGLQAALSEQSKVIVSKVVQFGEDMLCLTPTSQQEVASAMKDLSPTSRKILQKSICKAAKEKKPDARSSGEVDRYAPEQSADDQSSIAMSLERSIKQWSAGSILDGSLIDDSKVEMKNNADELLDLLMSDSSALPQAKSIARGAQGLSNELTLDLIDLTGIDSIQDLEDGDAVWLFDVSPTSKNQTETTTKISKRSSKLDGVMDFAAKLLQPMSLARKDKGRGDVSDSSLVVVQGVDVTDERNTHTANSVNAIDLTDYSVSLDGVAPQSQTGVTEDVDSSSFGAAKQIVVDDETGEVELTDSHNTSNCQSPNVGPAADPKDTQALTELSTDSTDDMQIEAAVLPLALVALTSDSTAITKPKGDILDEFFEKTERLLCGTDEFEVVRIDADQDSILATPKEEKETGSPTAESPHSQVSVPSESLEGQSNEVQSVTEKSLLEIGAMEEDRFVAEDSTDSVRDSNIIGIAAAGAIGVNLLGGILDETKAISSTDEDDVDAAVSACPPIGLSLESEGDSRSGKAENKEKQFFDYFEESGPGSEFTCKDSVGTSNSQSTPAPSVSQGSAAIAVTPRGRKAPAPEDRLVSRSAKIEGVGNDGSNEGGSRLAAIIAAGAAGLVVPSQLNGSEVSEEDKSASSSQTSASVSQDETSQASAPALVCQASVSDAELEIEVSLSQASAPALVCQAITDAKLESASDSQSQQDASKTPFSEALDELSCENSTRALDTPSAVAVAKFDVLDYICEGTEAVICGQATLHFTDVIEQDKLARSNHPEKELDADDVLGEEGATLPTDGDQDIEDELQEHLAASSSIPTSIVVAATTAGAVGVVSSGKGVPRAARSSPVFAPKPEIAPLKSMQRSSAEMHGAKPPRLAPTPETVPVVNTSTRVTPTVPFDDGSEGSDLLSHFFDGSVLERKETQEAVVDDKASQGGNASALGVAAAAIGGLFVGSAMRSTPSNGEDGVETASQNLSRSGSRSTYHENASIPSAREAPTANTNRDQGNNSSGPSILGVAAAAVTGAFVGSSLTEKSNNAQDVEQERSTGQSKLESTAVTDQTGSREPMTPSSPSAFAIAAAVVGGALAGSALGTKASARDEVPEQAQEPEKLAMVADAKTSDENVQTKSSTGHTGPVIAAAAVVAIGGALVATSLMATDEDATHKSDDEIGKKTGKNGDPEVDCTTSDALARSELPWIPFPCLILHDDVLQASSTVNKESTAVNDPNNDTDPFFQALGAPDIQEKSVVGSSASQELKTDNECDNSRSSSKKSQSLSNGGKAMATLGAAAGITALVSAAVDACDDSNDREMTQRSDSIAQSKKSKDKTWDPSTIESVSLKSRAKITRIRDRNAAIPQEISIKKANEKSPANLMESQTSASSSASMIGAPLEIQLLNGSSKDVSKATGGTSNLSPRSHSSQGEISGAASFSMNRTNVILVPLRRSFSTGATEEDQAVTSSPIAGSNRNVRLSRFGSASGEEPPFAPPSRCSTASVSSKHTSATSPKSETDQQDLKPSRFGSASGEDSLFAPPNRSYSSDPSRRKELASLAIRSVPLVYASSASEKQSEQSPASTARSSSVISRIMQDTQDEDRDGPFECIEDHEDGPVDTSAQSPRLSDIDETSLLLALTRSEGEVPGIFGSTSYESREQKPGKSGTRVRDTALWGAVALSASAVIGSKLSKKEEESSVLDKPTIQHTRETPVSQSFPTLSLREEPRATRGFGSDLNSHQKDVSRGRPASPTPTMSTMETVPGSVAFQKSKKAAFTRSPRLQTVLNRLRRRNGQGDGESTSSSCDPVDVDELFTRYDTIVKHMVVFDEDRLQRAQGSSDSQSVIDVTDLTDNTSTSSPVPASMSTTRSGGETQSTDAADIPVCRTSSSVSETSTTPSQKARNLRNQLDQALKTSTMIRTSQERLGAELSTFKSRLRQRRSLSPGRYESPRASPTRQRAAPTAFDPIVVYDADPEPIQVYDAEPEPVQEYNAPEPIPAQVQVRKDPVPIQLQCESQHMHDHISSDSTDSSTEERSSASRPTTDNSIENTTSKDSFELAVNVFDRLASERNNQQSTTTSEADAMRQTPLIDTHSTDDLMDDDVYIIEEGIVRSVAPSGSSDDEVQLNHLESLIENIRDADARRRQDTSQRINAAKKYADAGL